jgi:MFS family permease
MKKIPTDLWSLFWTQFFGALNDNVFKNALVLMITYQGVSLFGINSSALVALSGGVFILPFFFLSATSGQIADRYEKTMLVKIIKKFEILI